MWEALGCARLVVTGPELAAARKSVMEWAARCGQESSPPDRFAGFADAVPVVRRTADLGRTGRGRGADTNVPLPRVARQPA